MSRVSGIKRVSPFDLPKQQISKRRKTMSPQELHQKTMTGSVPLMSFPQNTSVPNITVVKKLRGVLETGLRSQKQIALENGLSQTMMSQFMNGATRVKGWTVADTLLNTWADNFNAHLEVPNEQKELEKTQQKVKESTKSMRSVLFTQPSVIKLTDQSNVEDYQENESSVWALKEEENGFIQLLLSDHSIIGGGDINHAEQPANIPIDVWQGYSARASGDWANFDIRRMFDRGPPQQYV